MNPFLSNTLRLINGLRSFALIAAFLIRLVRGLALAGIVMVLWHTVQPESQWATLILGGLTLVLAAALRGPKRLHKVSSSDLLIALDMNNPDAKGSPYDLVDADLSTTGTWLPHLDEEVENMRRFERHRLLRLLSTLPIPALSLAIAAVLQPAALSSTFDRVTNVVARLSDGAQLKILAGAPGDTLEKPLVLKAGITHGLELLEQNMIEITVVAEPSAIPSVDLYRRIPGEAKVYQGKPPFQSFRLAPKRGEQNDRRGVFAIAFSVKENIDLVIPSISRDQPVATLSVRKLPVPIVTLSVRGNLKTPWPDDHPLPLQITASAENPLKQIRLVIKAEGRTASENVSNILATDLRQVTAPYELVLESYVQSDLSRVEIVAEAVDQSVPLPLTGRSEPLFIETASAYGRYQQTLSTLKELKSLLDNAVKDGNDKLPPEAKDLAEKADEQSQESPFFDGLDRVNLSHFLSQVLSNEQDPAMPKILDIQERVNDFLYEHETLDDRERDRDFFVAARALSRLLEKRPEDRAVKLESMIEGMQTFLAERHKRWTQRVERLGQEPPSWPRVKAEPYAKAMEEITGLSQKTPGPHNDKSLKLLSDTVADYQIWIDELEKKEQEMREEQEKKRQEGLSSARDKLAELQKRQSQISSRLDQAGTQMAKMTEEWPSTRAMQKDNIKGTSGLEAQLRSLSPKAGARIKAALEAMNMTLDSGDNKAFDRSETTADMASRLLRQAQSAAQQSQAQKGRRERRRRVTGDSYYGRQVVGGDIEIKREYSVDRRYREEILEDVTSTKQQSQSEDEAKMLEDYLRKVVR